MFDNLTDRLSRTLRNISGRGRLTEENIKETLREVRMALLEADVALPVVRDFINRVKEKAVGHEVNKSLTPGQEFVKIVRNELVSAMGEENQVLNLAAQPPAVVLMAGLQGAGKTTSVGKLGKFLREKHKKKVLVVSADVYRPAAIKQLETLAEQVGVDFFHLVGKVKILGNGALAFSLGLLDHVGVHGGEFVGFTFDGRLEVGHSVADFASVAQMCVGMDGFGGGSSAEQLGNLGHAFFVGSLGKGKIFTVGLGFTGKSRHEIFLSLAHFSLLTV